jgi:hypothetical protein
MSETENNKPSVKVSEVLELLEQGKDRKEIAEHYGLPVSVMARTVWQHPKLKNRKAKKQYDVQIEDDTVDAAQTDIISQIAEAEGDREVTENNVPTEEVVATETEEFVETTETEEASQEEVEVAGETANNWAENPEE